MQKVINKGISGFLLFFGIAGLIGTIFFIPTYGVFQFNKTWFSPFYLIFGAIIVLTLLWRIYCLLNGLSEKALRNIMIGIAIVSILIQLVITMVFQTGLSTDDLRVKTQAYSLVSHSFHWIPYFYLNPNNVNVTIVYAWLLKLMQFLIPHNPEWGITLLTVLIQDFAIFLIIRLLWQNQKRIFASWFLVFCSLTFPLYFMNVFFYSDRLAILGPLLAIPLFFKSLSKDFKIVHFKWYLLSVLMLLMGSIIKPNDILFIIALLVTVGCTFYDRAQKKLSNIIHLAFLLIIPISLLVGFNFLTNSVQSTYGYHKDLNRAQPNTTYLYFAMNPNTNGQIDLTDINKYGYIKSAPLREQKEIAATLDRLNSMGVSRATDHFWRKFNFTFGRGTMDADASSLQSNRNKIQIRLQSIMFWLANLSQMIYIILWIGIIYFAIQALYKRLNTFWLFLTLSFLGFIVFHTFVWEAESRYAYLVLPAMLLIGSYGSFLLFQRLQSNNGLLNRLNKKKSVLIIGVIAVAFVGVATSWSSVTAPINEKSIASAQNGTTYGLNRAFNIKPKETITQRFTAIHDFQEFNSNALELNSDKTLVYIQNLANSKKYYISHTKINDGLIHVYLPGKPGEYQIVIRNKTSKTFQLWTINYSPHFNLSESSLTSADGKATHYYLPYHAVNNIESRFVPSGIFEGITLALVIVEIALIYCASGNAFKKINYKKKIS